MRSVSSRANQKRRELSKAQILPRKILRVMKYSLYNRFKSQSLMLGTSRRKKLSFCRRERLTSKTMSKITFCIKSTPQLKKSHLKKVARWLRVMKSRTELFTCLKKYAKMEGAS